MRFRAFLIIRTVAKQLSPTCWRGTLVMSSCCADNPDERNSRTSNHEDSAGHRGTICKFLCICTLRFVQDLPKLLRIIVTGGVQWMCAGKGIIHAEMPVHAKGQPDPRGLQLWVDLPKKVSEGSFTLKRRLTDMDAV